MDTLFCDELIQEVFSRIPPPSSAAVALVSRRWRRLLRSSTTSLSLHLSPPHSTSFSTFLKQHTFLSSLSVTGAAADDSALLAVAASCPTLRHLRLSSSRPVSPFSLFTLSTSCLHLSSITITIARPLSFHWLPYFKTLKTLSLFLTNSSPETVNCHNSELKDSIFDVELSLESLSLCGISSADYEISYLWRNCKNLKKLHFRNCESVGDSSSFSRSFLNNLQELELRTCRSIVDIVLLTLAKNSLSHSLSLESLLIYDGGSREGLLQFINQSNCKLKNLDLRLPLDLHNTHFIALSKNSSFRNLMSLRLQSCCLVTGEGLKSLSIANGSLEELALVNCDVVEKESGLLATLGQNLRKLRKLDLSCNDMLVDKEVVAMLVSCNGLIELKLRGCGRLTNAVFGSIVRSCRQLQDVDITFCRCVDMEGVEFFVLNSLCLRRIKVEASKLSEASRMWAVNKLIEVVSL